jgi:hypothetical protein
MKAVGLILISLVFLASSACQKKRRAEDSALVSAYKLIDAQRTDEAIQLLEAESGKMKPGDVDYARTRVALASAYAHKAGIKVQRFSKLLQIGKIKIKFKQKISNKAVTGAEAVDNFLVSLSGMLKGLAGISAVYTSIPTLNSTEERYLIYAIRILDGLDDKELRQGDYVYRAVLRAIYLKHYISTHLFEETTGDVVSVRTCKVDFNRFSTAVLAVAKVGIAIFDDLSFAQPKKAKEFQQSRQQLANVASDLTAISTFASLLDDASLMMAKNTFVQTGLRRLLKCADDQEPVISSPVSASAE